MTDLSAQTPVEIDTQLAKLYQDKARQEALIVGYRRSQERALSREEYGTYVDELQEQIEKVCDDIEALNEQIRPLQDEWARRPWTRYWLVTNSNGHVHRNTHCTTTYASTDFAWLTQCSGLSNDELVELAGEKACTVCFPDAPVDVLKRASKLTTPEREARQAERAAKRATAEASQVVVEGYRDYSRTITKTFKTVRAVTNQIASDLGTLTWYGPQNFQAEVHNIGQMIAALAAKGIEYDYDKALANARKKTVKDGGVAKY